MRGDGESSRVAIPSCAFPAELPQRERFGAVIHSPAPLKPESQHVYAPGFSAGGISIRGGSMLRDARQVRNVYWSKAQVQAREDVRIRHLLSSLNRLWKPDAKSAVDLSKSLR